MLRAPKARQSRYIASYVSLVVKEPTEIIILMLTCHGVVRGVALFKGHTLLCCTFRFRCVRIVLRFAVFHRVGALSLHRFTRVGSCASECRCEGDCWSVVRMHNSNCQFYFIVPFRFFFFSLSFFFALCTRVIHIPSALS